MGANEKQMLEEVAKEIRRAANPQKAAVNALIDLDWLEEAPLLEALEVKKLGDLPMTPYPAKGNPEAPPKAPRPERKKPGPKPGGKRRKPGPRKNSVTEAQESQAREAVQDRNRQSAREALDQMKKGLAGLDAFYAAFYIDVMNEEQEDSLDEMRAQAEGFYRGYAQAAHDLAGVEYEPGP